MAGDRQIEYTQVFINNEFVDAVGGKTFTVINPATAEKSCDVHEGEKEDIDLAVAAARAAFQLGSKWRSMDASARGNLMHKLANLIERDQMQIAFLISICNGKIYTEAILETNMAIGSLRYYAGWADKIHGKTIPADGQHFSYTRMEPVGVVGFVTPWNFPFFLTVLKLAPALASGCTVVHKPAEQTPLDSLHLASLFKEAGFPPGVYNVVPGFGPTCGQPLAEHMDVDKVSFTGSTEIGQLIQSVAGQSNSKRVTLETGGKSPLVICADADLDEAVMIGHMGLFFSQGQVCAASSRIYVHEDIYEEFVEKSKAMAMARVIGDPFEETTVQGPQVDKAQYDKIVGLLEIGKEEGAIVECGGGPMDDRPGYYIQPTVFSGVEDDMRIAKEEIFGPVQQLLKFKTINEVIQRANNTTYGLAAGIVTNNLKTALMFAQGVRAGSVWVNTYMAISPQTPFGGFKMSGFGREGGYDGLLPFLDIKTVTIKIPQKNS